MVICTTCMYGNEGTVNPDCVICKGRGVIAIGLTDEELIRELVQKIHELHSRVGGLANLAEYAERITKGLYPS